MGSQSVLEMPMEGSKNCDKSAEPAHLYLCVCVCVSVHEHTGLQRHKLPGETAVVQFVCCAKSLGSSRGQSEVSAAARAIVALWDHHCLLMMKLAGCPLHRRRLSLSLPLHPSWPHAAGRQAAPSTPPPRSSHNTRSHSLLTFHPNSLLVPLP